MAASHKLLPALVLFLSALASTAEDQVVFQAVNNTGFYIDQCSLLNEALPGQVFYPDSEEYRGQEASYYALAQSDLKPSCRVSPTSADDVSVVVRIAGDNECEFAVRSGGNMAVPGGPNIGPSGFTVDLQRMNGVSLSRDEKVVSVGPGASWKMVYHAVDAYNRSAVGGRTSGVAVAEFLLGVVLADGSIRVATRHSHPDLYWALKYGSTNFGIVTRFDLTTFPLADIWGGSFFYDIAHALPLLESLVTLTGQLADDPKGMAAVGFFWNAELQDYVAWVPGVYLEPITSNPPLFSAFTGLDFAPLSSSMRTARLTDLTDEVADMFTGGVRTRWFTLTVKPDAKILLDIHEHAAAAFKPDRQRAGFISGLTVQPISAGLAAVGATKGGNPMGIRPEDGDLLRKFHLTQFAFNSVLLLSVFWSDPADDAVLIPKFREVSEWAEQTARERGLLNRFLYMNYAEGRQHVMESVGDVNLAKMRNIRQVYDPEGVFKNYWRGGFKL
ncbi:hypothetical protein C8R46DRAFT_1167900 [Mycena filopes]|nr:hypothetical protein C8R46DRAFT_1167900 [Mycena filopes]